MKMTAEKRAIDKVFRRRNRYDIPEWQREEVWSREKKQRLIDTMLRGWKLPKFYFVKASGDDYLVEDGQQRLTAIWEFFSNDLPPDALQHFGAIGAEFGVEAAAVTERIGAVPCGAAIFAAMRMENAVERIGEFCPVGELRERG